MPDSSKIEAAVRALLACDPGLDAAGRAKFIARLEALRDVVAQQDADDGERLAQLYRSWLDGKALYADTHCVVMVGHRANVVLHTKDDQRGAYVDCTVWVPADEVEDPCADGPSYPRGLLPKTRNPDAPVIVAHVGPPPGEQGE